VKFMGWLLAVYAVLKAKAPELDAIPPMTSKQLPDDFLILPPPPPPRMKEKNGAGKLPKIQLALEDTPLPPDSIMKLRSMRNQEERKKAKEDFLLFRANQLIERIESAAGDMHPEKALDLFARLTRYPPLLSAKHRAELLSEMDLLSAKVMEVKKELKRRDVEQARLAAEAEKLRLEEARREIIEHKAHEQREAKMHKVLDLEEQRQKELLEEGFAKHRELLKRLADEENKARSEESLARKLRDEYLAKQGKKSELLGEAFSIRGHVFGQQDAIIRKDIREMAKRLGQGIRTIESHESILRDDVETNLMKRKGKLDDIKAELATEEEVTSHIQDISAKIMEFDKAAAGGNTLLKRELPKLKRLQESYSKKAQGLRQAIIAKIAYLESIRGKIEEEQAQQKEWAEQKKAIITAERELARMRRMRDFMQMLSRIGIAKSRHQQEKEAFAMLARQEQMVRLQKEREHEQALRIERDAGLRQAQLAVRTEESIASQATLVAKQMKAYEKRIRALEGRRKKRHAKLLGKLESKAMLAGALVEEEIVPAISRASTPVTAIPPGFPLEQNVPIPVAWQDDGHPDDLSYISRRIDDVREALAQLDVQQAKRAYIDIMQTYNHLSDENKGKVYHTIRELYEERKQAESLPA